MTKVSGKKFTAYMTKCVCWFLLLDTWQQANKSNKLIRKSTRILPPIHELHGIREFVLFLDQTEAGRAKKMFLQDLPPALLSKGLDDRPPNPLISEVVLGKISAQPNTFLSWCRHVSALHCMITCYFCEIVHMGCYAK